MIKGRFLLSGTIGALLVISNTANGISDPDFISEVKAARKKQKQLFDIKGFAKTPECLHKKKTTSMFKESLKCPHKEMQASLSKKTPKFLREVSDASVCLDCEENTIPGCNCHPSCSECGWDETFECDMDHEEETGPGNCFACADGSDVVPLHELHSGYTLSHGLCGDSSTCYDDCFEEIPDCECDPNCSACYRGEHKGEEEYECLACKDGSYIWNDCWEEPEAITCGNGQHQK
mmetsp:Transcript_21502/g.43073  ORF Transcript_21502/g.43073 Transcript_21502/m.43073 type:complete len:234 (-) Transcript_21502:93-794(-)